MPVADVRCKKPARRRVNTKIKPDDRRPALDLLAESGSDEAITALLGRLTFNYDNNMVSDEEEKTFVYETLVHLGLERVLPSLRKHLQGARSLSWGLRLASELCDAETIWTLISEILQAMEPGYTRDPTRKLQVLTFVGELEDERAVDALIPYTEDHDESVRFNVVEGLLQHENEKAREPLIKLLIDEDEESLRIKNRICEGFIANGWTVKGYRGSVEKALAEDFVVDGKGRIKAKRARK